MKLKSFNMKKILVPTDFSPASRKAEEYAAALSIILGAEMQLLHVYRELMPATTGPEPWSHTISELHFNPPGRSLRFFTC